MSEVLIVQYHDIYLFLFQGEITKILIKYGLSYRTAVEEVAKKDGPFNEEVLLRVLRGMLGIPFIIVETRAPTEKRGKKKAYQIEGRYILPGDKKFSPSKCIILVRNMISFYAPAMPLARVELNEQYTTSKEQVADALETVRNLLKCVPTSEFKTAFEVVEDHLSTAGIIIAEASVAIGTANIARLKIAPAPVPLTPTAKAPTRRRTSGSQEPGVEGILKYAKPVDTTIPINMCQCGEGFPSKEELDFHTRLVHATTWLCSHQGCKISYKSKHSLWTHVRTRHMNIWNYMCAYEEGCDFVHEETGFFEKHLEVAHNVKSTLHCPKCDHLFSQKNKLEVHMEICGVKVKAFACQEDNCGKVYKKQSGLDHHMLTDHAEGEEEPLNFPCPVPGCEKTFKYKNSIPLHMAEKHPDTPKKRYVPPFIISDKIIGSIAITSDNLFGAI